ncbi:MAG TPA: HDOD domain-containing protein [Steroidobacteraceae bacterium]|nr:HDOD domain-containing protein [Steroidobacteraceae bacterium]
MQILTQANSGSVIRPEKRLRDFTAMLEVEIAGDHIDLPSFPEVALRVRRALADEDASIDQVVRVVSAEPSLVVRLLQLGNSAALNPSGRRLTDLRAAITRIGFNMARSATIAFAMSQLRRADAYRGLEKPFNELWRTSTQVASVSFVVAKRLTKVNGELALLAGLLHTVGKLYLLTRAARFPDLLNDATVYPALVQTWHARIAQAILVNWEMAPPVIDAVQGFESCDREREGEVDLLDVLWVGRNLAALPRPPEAPPPQLLESHPARRLGLDAAACERVLVESGQEIDSLSSALGD